MTDGLLIRGSDASRLISVDGDQQWVPKQVFTKHYDPLPRQVRFELEDWKAEELGWD